MSGGTAAAVVLTAVAGLAGSVQVAVMGGFGERIGVLPALAFANAVAALLGLCALLAVHQSLAGYGEALGVSPWLWSGGFLGTFLVLSITVAAPRIGTTSTIGIIIAGNLVMAAVIDRFGLFGLERIPIDWVRLLGIALLAGGAALSLKK